MSVTEGSANLRCLKAIDDDISQAKKDLMLRFVKDQEALQTSQVDLKTVDDETLDLMDNISVSTAAMPDDTGTGTTPSDLQHTKRPSSRRNAKTRTHLTSAVSPKRHGVSYTENAYERTRDCAQRGVKAALVRHPRSPSTTSMPPSSRKIHKLSSSPLEDEAKDPCQSEDRILSGKRTMQTSLFKNDIKTVTKISPFKPTASGTATYVKLHSEGSKSPVRALYRPKSSYMLRHMQGSPSEDVQFGAKRVNSAGNQAKGEDVSTVLQVTRNASRTKIGYGRPSSRGRNVKMGSFEQTLTLDRQVDIESISSKDLKVINCASAESTVGPYKLVQKHQLPPIQAHEASPAPTPPV